MDYYINMMKSMPNILWMIDSMKNKDNTKNLILEPFCVILRLLILQFKEKGTKLSVSNNSIQYQEPSGQGFIRAMSGDCREDLHNLYHPILKSIEWYPFNEYQEFYDECIQGLRMLIDVYEDNSTIRHTISHYISAIENNEKEDYRKDQTFNPVIDKLRDIWDKDEIKAIHDLLQLIKMNKNKDIYLKTFEDILNAKELFVNEYINSISTSY
tara:strand:+ start:148 stop:783 length:636 start_codon:yes stop_codon:yes gene_type:complete